MRVIVFRMLITNERSDRTTGLSKFVKYDTKIYVSEKWVRLLFLITRMHNGNAVSESL